MYQPLNSSTLWPAHWGRQSISSQSQCSMILFSKTRLDTQWGSIHICGMNTNLMKVDH